MGEETKSQYLQVEGVTINFGGVQALKNVSFGITAGEILCLIGENGSGKSTLVKAISGINKPDCGKIIIEDREHTSLTPIEAVKAGIQVIYQDFSLFHNLTVAENIAGNYLLANERKLVRKKEMRTIAKKALAQIEIEMDIDRLVEELSVADKQLVAIARAMLHNAKLIIMDEPTTALTSREVKKLFKVVNFLKSEGCAIIFVSHKLDEVEEISDRIMVLRNGEKVIEDTIDKFDRDKLVYYISGREIEFSRNEEEPDNSKSILTVKGLTKKPYYEDISFELKKGEILGVTGLLGSGRNELVLSLFGIMKPDSGEIEINGKKVNITNVQSAIKNGIGYVPEDRLTEGLLLDESIERNTIIRLVNENKRKLIDYKELNLKAEQYACDLKIKTKTIKDAVKTLSGGNQQRVVLAKWLSILPEVLILNGPTVGVDVGSKSEIHEILKNLAKDGLSIIAVSDDTAELMQLCNRVIVIDSGKMVSELVIKEIEESDIRKLLK